MVFKTCFFLFFLCNLSHSLPTQFYTLFYEPFPYHKILRSNCVELDFKEISYLVLASVRNFLEHRISILYQSFFFKISSPIFQKNLTPNLIGPKHILNTIRVKTNERIVAHNVHSSFSRHVYSRLTFFHVEKHRLRKSVKFNELNINRKSF